MLGHDYLRFPRMSAAVASFRAGYRALAIEWDAAQGSTQEANRTFSALHVCYTRLRDSPSGREAITGLLDDPATAVRLLAATHCLAWEPARAQKVLEDIEQDPAAGLYAVDAKWTLRSYRQGKLDLDWEAAEPSRARPSSRSQRPPGKITP
jgi:hypothetical protein